MSVKSTVLAAGLWLLTSLLSPWVAAQDLATALAASLKYHPAIKGKQAEVQAQLEQVAQARAQRYPSLYMDANNLNDNRNQGTVGVDQPLLSFGKVTTAIKREKTLTSREQWDLLRVKRQVIEDTALAYSEVLGAQQRLAVALDNTLAHERLYQQIKRRSQGQLAAQADVDLAFARLQQARAQHMSAQSDLLIAENNLLALTQVPVAAYESIQNPALILPDDGLLIEQALAENADLQRDQAQVAAARLSVKSEKRASLPDISFRAEHDFLDDSLTNQDSTRTGFVITSRINGFGARSAIKGASARLAAAQYQLDSLRVDIRRQIQQLQQERAMQQALITSQTLAVKAIEQSRASYQRLYENGRRSWLELLNTQREYTEQQTRLVSAQNAWQAASLKLAARVGLLDP